MESEIPIIGICSRIFLNLYNVNNSEVSELKKFMLIEMDDNVMLK